MNPFQAILAKAILALPGFVPYKPVVLWSSPPKVCILLGDYTTARIILSSFDEHFTLATRADMTASWAITDQDKFDEWQYRCLLSQSLEQSRFSLDS